MHIGEYVTIKKIWLWTPLVSSFAEHANLNFSEAHASVPGASNKLGDWLIDWVCDFSQWASPTMEAAKDTKFGTKVA